MEAHSFLLHTTVSHNTRSCHFSSACRMNWRVRRTGTAKPSGKTFFSDGDILTTPSGSSLSLHTGWEFVEVQMRVSVFRVYKEALGTCQSQHFCAPAQPRLNCTCTHILFQLAQERNCSPSADNAVITAFSCHICYPNKRKSCGRTLIIWNKQIPGSPFWPRDWIDVKTAKCKN